MVRRGYAPLLARPDNQKFGSKEWRARTLHQNHQGRDAGFGKVRYAETE